MPKRSSINWNGVGARLAAPGWGGDGRLIHTKRPSSNGRHSPIKSYAPSASNDGADLNESAMLYGHRRGAVEWRLAAAPQLPFCGDLMRIFYLEDNPLIAFHVEFLIEDLGHTFAGTLDSFEALKAGFENLDIDLALIDIDLADGRTGPDAALWLSERSVPCLFMTGQQNIAEESRHLVLGIVSKPVTAQSLADALGMITSGKTH